MFHYDQYLVGELLEHRYDAHENIDDLDYYADLDRAMERLFEVNATAHCLADLFSQGMTEAELADLYAVPEHRIRYVLDVVFQALALILNGED